MLGRRRAVFLLVVAIFLTSCGGPSFTTKHAAAHRLARTDPGSKTEVGDAVTLDRDTKTSVAGAVADATSTSSAAQYPPGVSHRTVDGLDLVLQTDSTATFRQGSAVHLVLAITNKTGRSVGYLTNRETHFALIDQTNKTLWTDEQCRAKDTYNTVPTGYLEIPPGEHVSIDDYYPTHPGTDSTNCAAPAGHAYLTGGLTVCLNLAADGTCRGASDERIQATPIAVTIS
jgi:hypothetical protein